MEKTNTITFVTMIVTYLCGCIAKKHPKFNNQLIPIQNLLIGTIVALINYARTGNFNESLVVAGLLTGGVYDLGKNLSELVKGSE